MRLLKANKRMLDRYGPELNVLKAPLPKSLCAILDAGVVLQDDCVFLRAFRPQGKGAKLADFPDRTGYEDCINHIHVDDYAKKNWVLIAASFLARLSPLLSENFPGRHFRGTISTDEGTITDFPSCKVTFFCEREGEEMLEDDLEEYKMEAVCVFAL